MNSRTAGLPAVYRGPRGRAQGKSSLEESPRRYTADNSRYAVYRDYRRYAVRTNPGCTAAAAERWLTVLKTLRGCREMANSFENPEGLYCSRCREMADSFEDPQVLQRDGSQF